MSGPRPIADGQEVAHVVAVLKRLGFTVVGRSVNSSRYLRYGRCQFRLRVSNHEWPQHLRETHTDVIHSAVVAPPLAAADVPILALDIALGFLARARDRKGLVREHAA